MKNLVQVLIILFLTSSPSFTQELASAVEKLSRDADLILTGKVAEQQSEWNKEGTRIITNVKIHVDEYLKAGNTQQAVVVTHLGGEVGEVGELYSHTPKFINDEEVLLFLEKDIKENYKVLYGEEGKLTLYKDEISGEKITSSNKKVSVLKKEIKKYIGAE